MKQKIRWIIVILGILLLITAIVQNSHTVVLKLLFWETSLPASILLLVTAVISFLIGIFVARRVIWRRGR